MGQRRGADARFVLDGFFFACNRISIRINVPLIDTSNTEGVAADPSGVIAVNPQRFSVSKLPDITGAEIECAAATFSDDDNPFLKAIGLFPGSFHTITFYPTGNVGVQYGPWHCAYAGSEHTVMVPGAQPLTLKFETDGVSPDILAGL